MKKQKNSSRKMLQSLLAFGALSSFIFTASSAAIATPATTTDIVITNTAPTSQPTLNNDTTAAPENSGDTDHIPGNYQTKRPVVPADLMVDAKSQFARPGEKPDISGKVHHICAGKKLLFQDHIDAIYTTNFNGKLTTTIVDGASVMRNPENVCLRLAPDARINGDEVSRIVVPEDKNYRFLGKPGHIVWNAPATDYDWEKRPIWAGMGAFDANHEVKQPTNIRDNVIQQWMNVESAPGYVEIWVPSLEGEVKHLFSSQGFAPETTQQNIGLHGHINWSFSKAGVYRINFTSSYIDKNSGAKVVSEPMHQVWLIGSDKTVGLPENFTTGLRGIQKTAEDFRTERGLPTPEGDPVAQVEKKQSNDDGTTPTSPDNSELEAAVDELYGYPPANHYESGHFRMVGTADTVANHKASSLIHFAEGNNNGAEAADSYDAVLEVPDSLLRKITRTPGSAKLYDHTHNGWMWVLPKTAGNSSLGWDTRSINYGNVDDTVNVSLTKNTGPAGAVVSYVGWGRDASGKLSAKMLASTEDNQSYNWIHVDKPSVGVEDLVFTKPGIYTLDMNMKFFYKKPFKTEDPYLGTTTIGQNNIYNTVYFAVGNAAINYTRTKLHEQAVEEAENAGKAAPAAPEMLPVENHPEPKLPETAAAIPAYSSQPSESGTGETPGNGGAKPNPGTGTAAPTTSGSSHDLSAAEAEKLVQDKIAGAAKRVLIPVGHVDHTLVFLAGKDPEVISHWNLGTEIHSYHSNEFAYSVPGVNYLANTSSFNLPEGYKSTFSKGAYYLSNTNDDHSPWTGFSTQHTDFSNIHKDHKNVQVNLENFSGPGRLVIGSYDSLSRDFTPFVDSNNAETSVAFPENSHVHPMTFFEKPGIYEGDLKFSYMDNDMQQKSYKIRSMWIVGDATLQAAKAHLKLAPGTTYPTLSEVETPTSSGNSTSGNNPPPPVATPEPGGENTGSISTRSTPKPPTSSSTTVKTTATPPIAAPASVAVTAPETGNTKTADPTTSANVSSAAATPGNLLFNSNKPVTGATIIEFSTPRALWFALAIASALFTAVAGYALGTATKK